MELIDIRYAHLEDEDAEEIYKLRPDLRNDICPTCIGTGRYKWQGVDGPCDCRLQIQLTKHYLHAGIPVAYHRLGFSDLELEREKDIVEKYIENAAARVTRGIGWVFHGEFGSGKTLTAMLILKGLVISGYRCYATTFSSLVDMYAGGWRDDVERQRFEARTRGSQVLLIDDLGKEFQNKSGLSATVFDNVLRSRVQSGLATFVTTNLDMPALEVRYGEATISLLKESCLLHEFKHPDYRSKANERLKRELDAGEVRPVF